MPQQSPDASPLYYWLYKSGFSLKYKRADAENMITGQGLKAAFEKALFHFTSDDKVVKELWRDVEEHYTSSSRYYHNLAHLEHLFESLLPVQQKIEDWDILILAIAYHDIIYNICKNDNEEKSAAYADKMLNGILTKEKRELLSQFIIATKAHGGNSNRDSNYFTDADLSILGASPDVYDLYTKNIRKEYRFYPLFIYKPGRAKVVKHFLSMHAIFKTEFFSDKLGKRARENLERELEELQ